MGRAILRVVLVLVAVTWATPLWAGEGFGGPPAPDQQKKADRPAKDPVAEAFILPKGVALTPKQSEAYHQIRQQFEPLLRSAIERVQSTTDEKGKLEAVAEVKQIREQIRLAILEILSNPSLKSSKAVGKTGQGKKKAQGKNKGRGRKKAGTKKAAPRGAKKPGAKRPAPRKPGGGKRKK